MKQFEEKASTLNFDVDVSQYILYNVVQQEKRITFIISSSKLMQKDHQQESQQPINLPVLSNRKSSSSNICDICFEPYHIMGRWPMLACPNLHSFCDHCIQGMFKINQDEPIPCPICRALIRHSTVRPNYELFRVINKQSTVKQALEKEQNELFLYAFQHEIFEVAAAFKQGKMQSVSKLTKVDCSERKIAKIQHMSAFPSLVELRLDRNSIVIPQGLQNLGNLRFLNLSHNPIKDIAGLTGLHKLSHLALEFCQIEEIPSLLPFSNLSHWFLFGNPLKGIIIDEILLVTFKNLLTFSISTIPKDQVKITQIFLKGLTISNCMPKLYKIYTRCSCFLKAKRQIQDLLTPRIKIEWIKPQQQLSKSFSERINTFFYENHQYGQIFQFKLDHLSPHYTQYTQNNNQIVKLSDSFVIVNSLHQLAREGKINLKFKIETPSPNLVIGICNAFLKHNPNVYSEHFIGLTSWGAIYNRGQSSTFTGKLRLQNKPVIRMSVDHLSKEIKWYSDDQLVGYVPFSDQLRYSTLYFLIGMRDTDTSILILNE